MDLFKHLHRKLLTKISNAVSVIRQTELKVNNIPVLLTQLINTVFDEIS